MEGKNWLSTGELIDNLKKDADNEHEYSVFFGNKTLRSTHWFLYDSARNMFGHTRDWPYDWFSESAILEFYSEYRWKRFL